MELTGVAAGEPFQQHLVGFLAVQCLVQHVQRPLRQHPLLADPALTSQGHSPIRLQRQRWGQQPILLQPHRPKRPLRRAVEIAQAMVLHQERWLGQLVKIFLSRQRKFFHGIPTSPFPVQRSSAPLCHVTGRAQESSIDSLPRSCLRIAVCTDFTHQMRFLAV